MRDVEHDHTRFSHARSLHVGAQTLTLYGSKEAIDHLDQLVRELEEAKHFVQQSSRRVEDLLKEFKAHS